MVTHDDLKKMNDKIDNMSKEMQTITSLLLSVVNKEPTDPMVRR
jgi:hypothetical protein